HVYLQQKNYLRAIELFNRAQEINPKAMDSYEGLGLCYFEQGRIAEAMEKFNYVLNFDPDNEHVHFGLGLCCQQEKEFDKAIEEFKSVSKINSQHYQIYSNIGMCYYQKNNFSEAIECFKQALKIDPSDCYAHQGLAQIYLKQNNILLCLEELQKIKEAGLIDESYRYLLSQLYMQQKHYDPAIEELLKSVSNDYIEKTAKAFSKELDFAHKQGDCTIKIVRIPNFYGPEILSTEMNSIMLPPLAMGSIVSHLRSQGASIHQDDLHIKIHYDNYFSEDFDEKIDETIFFEEHRIIEYTKGKEDPGIDSIMERVLRKTEFQGYKIVLFSLDSCSMNFSHVMFSLCLAKHLKGKYNPVIILGGLTYFPELMRKIGCKWPDIDYVICGEGEEVLSKLLFSLLGNLALDNRTITKINQKVLYADKVPIPVKPDFNGLPLDRYRYRGIRVDYRQKKRLRNVVEEFNISKAMLLPIRFTKGCTNKCIFCASSYGGLIHVIEPKTVVSWLEDLQKKYNPTGYLFLNDTLNISKKYLDQLCDEIIKRKLKILWSDCVRVDRLDKNSIDKMREAGCIRMVFGMETASKRMLEYINKDINLGQLEEMLYLANKAGIWTGIEIIGGLPYETEKDVRETISFIKRNKKHIDSLYYNAFNIKDTSLLSKYPERYGITNIFEISNYEDGFSTFVKYGFDETRGLKWPEKRKQIVIALNKIIKNFGGSPFPEHEYEQFLFFLYSKYSDKKSIKKLFYSVGSEKMRYTELLRKKKVYKQHLKLYKSKTLIYGGK
ncbi:MAG: tetratricopeptide repeat protein, partial [Candidatus Omnitrophica bacterium]|nr:tetratricopeptide repeat protein [Candidatus Omnitrophota bacterium]